MTHLHPRLMHAVHNFWEAGSSSTPNPSSDFKSGTTKWEALRFVAFAALSAASFAS